MLFKIALCSILAVGILGNAPVAFGQDAIHKYFSDTALQVKSTDNAVQKRELLDKKLDGMIEAFDIVQGTRGVSHQDRLGLDRIQATLQEKDDELAGRNGFRRVPDDQLNAFSDYIVQDMEQAHTITIGVVTALLIVIIIILLV